MTKAHDASNTLREMSEEQLSDHLLAQRRKLFEVRMQQATGQVENFRQIREIRKEIARTMTVQVEAANAQAAAGVAQ